MPDNRKFVIFDLDGTLIDSYGCACVSINKALSNLGHSQLCAEDIKNFSEIGSVLSKVREILGDSDYIRFKYCYDEIHAVRIANHPKLIEPTIKLLSETISSYPSIHIVFVTNKELSTAKYIVNHSLVPSIKNIKRHHIHIIGRKRGEDSIKKNFNLIRDAFEELQLKVSNCIFYCGDSAEDEFLSSELGIENFIFCPKEMVTQHAFQSKTDLEKGLDYIFSILKYIQEESKRLPFSAPKLIYRGITQRNFTSSPDLLIAINNKEEKHKILSDLGYWEAIEGKDAKNLSREPIDCKEWFELISSVVKNRINQNVGNKVSISDNFRFLKSIVENPRYYHTYLKPAYIRSGAAVRLNGQMPTHRHVDYLWYIRNLISEAKRLYPDYQRRIHDLDVLAEIQHMGGATCLVDFSRNFLVALWFATQDYNISDRSKQETGYLLCYDVNYDSIIKDNLKIINNREKEEQSIESILLNTRKSIKYNGNDSYKFVLWTPSNSNNRIIRQDSVFLFGIEPFKIDDHKVTVIPIPFVWKKAIQMTLKTYFGISSISLYGDTSGYATSNNKFTSLSISSSYFCEDNDWPEGIGASHVKDYELFQIGTGCLIKGEYEHALDYMHAFLASNTTKFSKSIDSIDSEAESGISKSILYIESVYSKALCFRHLEQKEFAIDCYREALTICTNLQSTLCKSLNDTNNDCQSEKYLVNLNEYLNDKRYKILDGYIGLLLDLNYHKMAYDEIGEIIKNESSTNGVNTTIFLYTVQNEIVALARLWNNIDAIKHCSAYDINVSLGMTIPYCTLLNHLFDGIIKLCNETDETKYQNYVEKLKIKASNIEKELPSILVTNSTIETNINTTSSNRKDFCEWDLSDIKEGIESFCKQKPKKRKCMMEMLSIVDRIQRLIEGRRTVIQY